MTVPRIWRRIKETYNLIGKKCKECNNLYFPAREVCKKCGSFELEDYKFSGRGKIITYTIIRTPSFDNEYENLEIPSREVPYILAIIQLEEGPKLTAEIVDIPHDEVKIGLPVEVVFRKIKESRKGVIQYGYKFQPRNN